MDCWYCGNPVVWDNDFSYEDECIEGEGIITLLHCPHCDARYQIMRDL